WYPTTVEELKTFIAVHVLMGLCILPQVTVLSSDPIFAATTVPELMSKTRFEKLTENIHCSDNSKAVPKGQPGHDRLHKLRPLIDALNSCLKEVYVPSRCQFEESTVPFKGRSSGKQYMPVKRGYKVWCLADTQTGFVSHFEIYSGKKDASSDSFLSLGESVVLGLCHTYNHSRRLIAFNHFFSSYRLMKTMHDRGLYAVGMVRASRRGLTGDAEERGESLFRTKGCVSAVKWQDSKPVMVLSTFHNPEDITTVRSKNRDGSSSVITCPRAVAEYDAIMGGVDRFEKRRERYAIGRRSAKWWHRLLYFLVDLAIVNSFIMWDCTHGGRCDQLSFRTALVRQLAVGQGTTSRGRPSYLVKNKQGVSGVPEDVRLVQVGKHLPIKATRRRCRECSAKKKQTRTTVMCSQCRVPLCVTPCFQDFHSK
uniref:PiggyBac transposable element-derived protein domain-containing protein n=1 Tax=Loxodonta africana TaxID=9785 RepID=G3U0L7_LOXAF